MANRSIRMTLDIDFDEISNIEVVKADLRYTIEERVFGHGAFDENTLVNEYRVSIESN